MTAGYLSHRPHYQLQRHCSTVCTRYWISIANSGRETLLACFESCSIFACTSLNVQSSSPCIQINTVRIHPWENSSSSSSHSGKRTSNEILFLMNIIYFCVIPANAITIVAVVAVVVVFLFLVFAV